MGIIYTIRNKINGKYYVGQTTQKLNDRIYRHLSAANHGSEQLIHKAIRKYGIDNFTINTIQNCSTQDELNTAENDKIKEYNSMVPVGYNLKTGGHNVTYSYESRLKMSLAHKGKRLSEKQKAKISKSNTGNAGPWLGKKLSKEHRKNISKGNIGKTFSEDTKIKISKTKMGSKNPMYGKYGSKNPNAKSITLIDPNGEIETFGSLSEACRKHNLDVRNLSAVFTGKRKSHKGFKIANKLQDRSIK